MALFKSKVIHTFSKKISPKVNVISQLEFELAYLNVTVELVSKYTRRVSCN